MNIRRPSDWAKQDNQEYLGHFRQDKYLNEGHNRCNGAEDKAACESMFQGFDADDADKSAKDKAKDKGPVLDPVKTRQFVNGLLGKKPE